MAMAIRQLVARSARPGARAPCTPLLGGLGTFSRGFSTNQDPYKVLGLDRNASEADVKKAYRDQALRWHPDKNPDNKEEAQKRFSEATTAYEVLKDPETRRQFDLTGRTGGPGGQAHGAPGGGFHHHGTMSQADAERIFREAFGQQGLDQVFQQLFQQQHSPFHGGRGPAPGGRPHGVVQVGDEVRIRADVAAIHRASRACGIDTDNDERRARCAGKVGVITKADPKDQSVKVRVMVMPGRADDVWFGAGAVMHVEQEQAPPQMDPFAGLGSRPQPHRGGATVLRAGMEVEICPDLDSIHAASRASGIKSDNDERRARCAGKIGTIIDVDPRDRSVKVRVMVLPGRADEVWFGADALRPVEEPVSPHIHPCGFAASKAAPGGQDGFASAF
eukprot:TRINITY_DN73553_c0_g1_i1.p1 TRINITY_DN73553_c0_g1~~TRINITY_DN73553_c0_g1_i1.p1  ORF type:complete len:401 (+),score=72.01 TRINITY_DN73553_c0_g1_i1:35-1204(+)